MSNRRDRQREIAEVLSRHGLGYLVGLLGLDRWVPFHHGLLGHEPREAPYTRPDHVRLALEQLGPTFVKLGQVLSTRPDLLAPEYQVELVKLQDAAPAVAADIIREVVAHELGTDLEATFATFDFEPLAAASIGQAHAATLRDGTGVVVKVRRPGAVEQIEQDLEILHDLAFRASRHWAAAADYDLLGLADEPHTSHSRAGAHGHPTTAPARSSASACARAACSVAPASAAAHTTWRLSARESSWQCTTRGGSWRCRGAADASPPCGWAAGRTVSPSCRGSGRVAVALGTTTRSRWR